jgi:hypothetical protein
MDKHHKKIRSSCKNTRPEIILDKKTKQRRRKMQLLVSTIKEK